ncbi:MAG: glycosyltransferase family 4 protein [Nitrospinae bacterium]|nr:glycosyltransferase family 4 protein [Nitrospinota bacterium]
MSGRRLLYFVTEDWYFWSHRLAIARAARDSGYEVTVATAVNEHGGRIAAEGFELAPLSLSRRSVNPIKETAGVGEIVSVYRRVRPHIVHHVALKPVIYGSIAAAVADVPVTVNALAGLGHVFVAKGLKAALTRGAIKTALGMAMRRGKSCSIFQNPDDMRAFVEAGIVEQSHAELIMGSGVDTGIFEPPQAEPAGTPVILLSSRMLSTKGVFDFVEAARILKSRGVSVRMALAGSPDPHNPSSIPLAQLAAWNDEGVVEYWGMRENMPETLRETAIVALPSFYGEGVPKSLIEAASSARPVIAYDIPGCREIVRDGVNGYLAPLRDVAALAGRMETLLADSGLRGKMGAAGREMVINGFSEKTVIEKTLALYSRRLKEAGLQGRV